MLSGFFRSLAARTKRGSAAAPKWVPRWQAPRNSRRKLPSLSLVRGCQAQGWPTHTSILTHTHTHLYAYAEAHKNNTQACTSGLDCTVRMACAVWLWAMRLKRRQHPNTPLHVRENAHTFALCHVLSCAGAGVGPTSVPACSVTQRKRASPSLTLSCEEVSFFLLHPLPHSLSIQRQRGDSRAVALMAALRSDPPL